MLGDDYNWKRFWIKRDGQLVLTEEGYLQDPESEYGDWTNPFAVPFDSIHSLPCLVLLGEPGIGKTEAVNGHLNALELLLNHSRDRLIFKNLNSFGSEERLIRETFGSQDFLDWKSGAGDLYLILDSLDECLLRIDTVVNILAGYGSRVE